VTVLSLAIPDTKTTRPSDAGHRTPTDGTHADLGSGGRIGRGIRESRPGLTDGARLAIKKNIIRT